MLSLLIAVFLFGWKFVVIGRFVLFIISGILNSDFMKYNDWMYDVLLGLVVLIISGVIFYLGYEYRGEDIGVVAMICSGYVAFATIFNIYVKEI